MLRNVIRFYVEGFREMTLGRTLWAIILIKLFVLFAVLKLFFMPDPLAGRSSEERSSHLLEELTPTAPATVTTVPAITTDPAPAAAVSDPAPYAPAAVSDPAPYASAAAATDPGPKTARSTPAAQSSPAARATNLNNH